jgi:hypothetical protein
MKTVLIVSILCICTLLTGCRTVAVVDHGGPTYVRSGYYGRSYYGRPAYYSSRRYYNNDRYYGSRSRYYGGSYDRNRSYRSGYSRSGYYGDRTYYRTPRTSARVIIR